MREHVVFAGEALIALGAGVGNLGVGGEVMATVGFQVGEGGRAGGAGEGAPGDDWRGGSRVGGLGGGVV